MITPEQMNEMLEAAKPSIVEGFKKEIAQSITWQVKDRAGEIVRKAVEDWIKENIIPEIYKELAESKESFISLGATIAPMMVQQLTEALAGSFKERMESSYERRAIFKACFGD